MPPKQTLSKSTFMYGCQCPKRLWLHKFQPELRDEATEAQAAIFQSGTDVGLLAQQLFPGGVNSGFTNYEEYKQSARKTASYIRQVHTIIYEAAFEFDGIYCAIDILVKNKDNWFAYEVKSSTKVKDPFIQDAALQYYVISQSGLALEDISIIHLDNEYVRYGELDVRQLFNIASIKDEVTDLQPFIKAKTAELKKVLRLHDAPVVDTGDHCHKPYGCDFYGFCTKDQPEEETDYGPAYINKKAIRDFIRQLKYPLHFMDFETWMTAVPELDGHWSYRQVPFQFSVHIQSNAGAHLKHHAYLAEGPHTASLEFLESLLQVTGNAGSILVYNKTFENSRLNELKEEFPGYAKAIENIQVRMIDLMTPFRKQHYRLPQMQGSYSIKYVLPALVPELNYSSLAITNGGDASAAFYNLRDISDVEERESIRCALLEYCGLDTLAMVKILGKLLSV